MTIKHHFLQETLAKSDVWLEDDEEKELTEFLDELKEAAKPEGLPEGFSEQVGDMVINIASLAFVAGRSYQLEIDESEFAADVPQFVDLRISSTSASRLLEFLLHQE